MKRLVPGGSFGGGGTPGGSSTQVQFNDNGFFGGDADLTWNKTTNVLDVGGDVVLDDGGTYTTTLQTITPTANRTISLPNATGTVALVAGSSGQLVYNNAGSQAGAPGSVVGATGDVTLGLNGAASTPPLDITGTWFTGGTSTTTKPQVLIEPTGTTSTAWSTSGTGLGINATSGFTGRLLDLQTNGTSRAVVTGAGNVGIGTTSPTVPLFVNGEIYAKASAGGDNDYGVSICSGPSLANTSAHKIRAGGGTGQLLIIETQTAGGNGQTVFATNGTERLRIDSSGRLLVGTSTSVNTKYDGSAFAAESQLASTGIAAFSLARYGANSDGSALTLGKSRGGLNVQGPVNADDTLGYIGFTGSDGANPQTAATIRVQVDGTPGAGDMPGRLVFSTTADGAASPTERMRIPSSGGLLIKTTSRIDGGLTTIGFDGAIEKGLVLNDTNPANTRQFIAFDINGTTQIGFISNNNNTGVTYSTSSDYRLKENVIPVTNGITRLQQLKPSRFNFIADPDNTVDGFIAHEAQAVVPECVTGTKDEVDDNGNPVYQGIDQSKLVPLLTAALQEAIGEIESLKARLTAVGI